MRESLHSRLSPVAKKRDLQRPRASLVLCIGTRDEEREREREREADEKPGQGEGASHFSLGAWEDWTWR